MRVPALLLTALLCASPARADGETCEAIEDPAQGGPICRYSEDPAADIRRVLEPLKRASGYPHEIKLFFVESPEVNAMTVGPNVPPNKENVAKIAVSAGIWDMAQSDSEMAFILAHEMSHLSNLDGEHLVATIPKLVEPWFDSPEGQRIQNEVYARNDLTDEQKSAEVVRRFQQLVVNPRKREIEQMADVNALNLMNLVNQDYVHQGLPPPYPIDAAITFLNRIREYHPEHDKVDMDSDHPGATERIAAAEGIRIYHIAGRMGPEDGSATRTRRGKKSTKGVKSAAEIQKAARKAGR